MPQKFTVYILNTFSKDDIHVYSIDEAFNSMKNTLKYATIEDDTALNKFNIELNIKQLQDEAEDYMMKAACTEGNKTKYLDEVEKIFGKVKILREQLELLEESSIESDSISSEKDRITELFEKRF